MILIFRIYGNYVKLYTLFLDEVKQLFTSVMATSSISGKGDTSEGGN